MSARAWRNESQFKETCDTFNLNAFWFTPNFWETQLGVKQDNSTCLLGRDVMDVSSKKTVTDLTWTPDQNAFLIYQVETQLLNRLIITEVYGIMHKFILLV